MKENMKFENGEVLYPPDFDLVKAGDQRELKCALCGQTHSDVSHSWRVVRKRNADPNSGRRFALWDGYYRPRLSEDELYALPEGEQVICTNRTQCRNKRLGIVRFRKTIGAKG